jgi:radial spoke head protein 9
LSHLESDKSLERDDFLDPLSHDSLKKSWSLQTDESKTEITLRSLVWPGYVGYHRTNSSIFGGVYMGSGIKSQDFAFLV